MPSYSRPPRAPWIDQLVAQATGPVRVQVTPSVAVSLPVEVFGGQGPSFVGPRILGLPPPLEDELVAWLRWWEAHVDDSGGKGTGGTDAEWRAWAQEERRLVIRVQGELGRDFQVTVANGQEVRAGDGTSEGLVSMIVQLVFILGFGSMQFFALVPSVMDRRWVWAAIHAVLLGAMVLGFVLTVKHLLRARD